MSAEAVSFSYFISLFVVGFIPMLVCKLENDDGDGDLWAQVNAGLIIWGAFTLSALIVTTSIAGLAK